MIRQYLVIEDGELVVNKKNCFLIPEFKVLFDRDKGCVKDITGRHKYLSCAEMKFIYLHNDPRSEYYNTPFHLCEHILRDLSGVPSNWKIDKAFTSAIEKYKELQSLSSAGSAYFSAEAALFDLGVDTRFTSDTIRTLKIDIQAMLKQHTKRSKEYTQQEYEVTVKLSNMLDGIMKLQNDNINIINKMPSLSKTIKDLKERYAEEDNDESVVVGGGHVFDREN
jgi:hypothetical protein